MNTINIQGLIEKAREAGIPDEQAYLLKEFEKFYPNGDPVPRVFAQLILRGINLSYEGAPFDTYVNDIINFVHDMVGRVAQDLVNRVFDKDSRIK